MISSPSRFGPSPDTPEHNVNQERLQNANARFNAGFWCNLSNWPLAIGS
jgi:hypothetical protein